MSRDISKVTLRPGTVADVPAALRLMDIAIEWLVAKGNTSQWGSEPVSQNPERIKQGVEFAESGGMWLAVTTHPENGGGDGGGGGGEERVVGALCVGGPMPYVKPAAEPEMYVKFLLTDRAWAGCGLGALLLDKARELAREAGVGLLRLDCFAGGDGKLVKYYESQGLTKTETFVVEGWPGAVLEQRLDVQA